MTHLQWQDDVNLSKEWNAAMAYCDVLSLDGGGWRLPSVVELQSIVLDGAYNPSIDATVFKHYMTSNSHPSSVEKISGYWSSTNTIDTASDARIVNFKKGYTSYNPKSENNYVRCVRESEKKK